ncbi:MAG: U32 family peptidase [Bacteroidales bacterium]|nr:U32 family peptidase [Bacteroidales bacterium]
MAPAGSYESLQAAIQGGADAVYFGVEKLNMRSRSSFNFTLDDLDKVIAIAGEHQMNTYLTLNSVIYNNELEQVKEITGRAGEAGITAIIASDPSVISTAHEAGIEVHISTQLNISNIESLKFYTAWADVVVLARELNLDQVKAISYAIQERDIIGPSGKLIRLELFIHGALCMAISGKCYLSLHQYGYSANRGACLQACRRSYIVTEKETGKELEIDQEYIMSPKDLCTISFLDRILDAGVSVLKIEGRARSPEYVKTVTECYNEAITSCIDGTFTRTRTQDWEQRLSKVFNRGFWDGYYLGQELGEWSKGYGSNAAIRKIYIGKGMNYFSKLGVAEFLVESNEINVGDEILVTGPTTGVMELIVSELQVERKQVETAEKGEHFSIPVPGIIRRSDKLYKLVNTSESGQ